MINGYLRKNANYGRISVFREVQEMLNILDKYVDSTNMWIKARR